MNKTIVDRWYQTEAVDAFYSFVKTNRDPARNPVLVLPTGTGKSIIIARVIQRALQKWSETRVLMLSHVGELVRQDADKLQAVWPDAPIGICSATLGAKDTNAPILFGNVQSVAGILRRTPDALGERYLIIIDECHMLSENENSMYRRVIDTLRAKRPSMRVLGLSATPYRMKGGLLTQQENAVFTDIIYDLSRQFDRLIDEGFLCPIVTLRTEAFINLEGVRTRAGEYSKEDIAKVLSEGDVLEQSCKIIAAYGQRQERKSWLVFVSGIMEGERTAAILKELGVNAIAVNSSHSQEENDAAMSDFRAGKVKCLVSADQLTTGFDAPNIDLIGMLRPTKSVGLYIQMLGRGLRICEGKTNCLVLDFARNIERLGPINDPHIPQPGEKKNKGNDKPIMKVCPECGAYCRTFDRNCPNCGHVFEIKSLTADGLDALAIAKTIGKTPAKGNSIVLVTGHQMRKHVGPSGVPCIDCAFQYEDKGRIRAIHVYMCFGHKGRALEKAKIMWRSYKGQTPAPSSVEEALKRQGELQSPLAFEIKKRNFYQHRLSDEIIDVIWS